MHTESVPARAPLRRLAPQVKIVAVVLFAIVVVATPAAAWPALVLDAVAVVALATWAGLRPGWVLSRMAIEIPFVVFVVAIPFVTAGPRTHIGPVGVSEAGLVSAGLILARATLGVAAVTILMGATTRPEILDGLQRLRLPRGMVEILSFMIRFLGVVVDDLNKMTIARLSRGDGRRRAARMAAYAASTGHLFVRCYERGERVQLAMRARGYRGYLPVVGSATGAPVTDWLAGLVLPAIAGLGLLAMLAGGLP